MQINAMKMINKVPLPPTPTTTARVLTENEVDDEADDIVDVEGVEGLIDGAAVGSGDRIIVKIPSLTTGLS